MGGALFNDLEEAVFRLHPRLTEIKQRLLDAGAAGALVSGSGSCLFGLFESKAAALRARQVLRRELPGRLVTADFLTSRTRWGVVKR